MNKKKYRIGIIAEYNPFHNGHIYQIEYIKKKWPHSTIIVVMSGKYVQRGEIAISSFEERKKVALEHGVDEIYELPFEYATQAAHIFAKGAIFELQKQKIDYLVFGSETNNIDDFYLVANALKKNEDLFFQEIRKKMKEGISFPKANQIVLENMIGKSFRLPNDILGLEYVKVIVLNNLSIKPFCLKRTVGFHSDNIVDNITSASNIRKMIFENNQEYKKYTPMIFNKTPDRIENYYKDFQEIVNKKTSAELSKIKLVDEGIENLFKKNINCLTYEEFINKTNSRRYTSSRIKRIMLYILLDIPR